MTSFFVTTSWDDGHKMDLRLAKMLQKYGASGTFYVSPLTHVKHRENRLTEAEIEELDVHHEVGAHTLNHVRLDSISINEAEAEIEGSKLYLERLLGHEIAMFSYPWGRYNRKIKEIVKNNGFSGARTCNGGSFALPTDPYELQTTLHASNGSPLLALEMAVRFKTRRILLNWESRAKLLFDLFLREGGIFHLWGHSWEIDRKNDWGKLERVLQYISGRNGIEYRTNGEILELTKR
jgi:peptidoglycan/xylan/chitin deacetylase (PgdA/CDA1 family)